MYFSGTPGIRLVLRSFSGRLLGGMWCLCLSLVKSVGLIGAGSPLGTTRCHFLLAQHSALLFLFPLCHFPLSQGLLEPGQAVCNLVSEVNKPKRQRAS